MFTIANRSAEDHEGSIQQVQNITEASILREMHRRSDVFESNWETTATAGTDVSHFRPQHGSESLQYFCCCYIETQSDIGNL